MSDEGILVRAARAASPRASARYGAVQTFKDERERDPEFARQWDEALLTAEASIEAEIYRRAQEGVEEPIYGGKYREKGLWNDAGDARGRVSNAGLTHMGRKRRDVHGEPLPTETRPCLRCRKPFESEGAHHRLCGPCANRVSETSPYAV